MTNLRRMWRLAIGLALGASALAACAGDGDASPVPAAPAPAAPAAAPAPPATPTPCGSLRGLNFICGMINVEDMLPVDGGKAIVASSYKDASVGFYLIDTTAKTAKAVTLSVAAKADPLYSDCPGAPDLTKLSTHGLDVRPGRNGTATVYAINHGGRESVEIFELHPAANSAEWIGCALAPEGATSNSISAMRGGGFAITKFMDTHEDRKSVV